MKRQAITTQDAPEAIGPYSQAIRTGDLVFCSGQLPLDPKTGDIRGDDDVGLQTQQVMENLSAVLNAAGSSLSDIIKTTIFLMDLDDFATVNEVYGGFFQSGPPPARACFQVAALPKGARIEIEAVAVCLKN